VKSSSTSVTKEVPAPAGLNVKADVLGAAEAGIAENRPAISPKIAPRARPFLVSLFLDIDLFLLGLAA
jgi:hypothetical protein